MKRSDLFRYVEETYGTRPDYPWAGTHEHGVLRHKHGKKWYGLFMTLPASKLGLPYDTPIEVINLKVRPEYIGSLRMKPGIFPGYHMNKNHWVSVMLEGHLSREEITGLIDESHALTKPA